MFDGIDDDGLDEDGVMNLEVRRQSAKHCKSVQKADAKYLSNYIGPMQR